MAGISPRSNFTLISQITICTAADTLGLLKKFAKSSPKWHHQANQLHLGNWLTLNSMVFNM